MVEKISQMGNISQMKKFPKWVMCDRLLVALKTMKQEYASF